MKYLKMLGLAAVAAMAMTAFTAGSASAVTLEINGSPQNGSVTITASLLPGTSAILSRTDGSFANTCLKSHAHGVTTRFHDPVTGPLTGHPTGNPEDGLSFAECTRPVQVHRPGTLEVTKHIAPTDGTVFSEDAIVTVGSPFGTLNCQTGATTHIGRLTGTDGTPAHFATLDVNAVINCGFLVPSAVWNATYEITSPTGLGVVA
jgi:hypothetical protein